MTTPDHTVDAERSWIHKAKRGDRQAFEQLVVQYQDRLYSFLRRRCGHDDDAAELTQEAFLRAWTHLARYSDRYRFSTWLFTIASRLAASRHRRHEVRRRAEAALPTPSHDGQQPSPDPEPSVWAVAEQVLTEEQRAAIWLRYAQECDMAEIARILGKRQAAVRMLLSRARQAIGDELERRQTCSLSTQSSGAYAGGAR